MTTDLPPGLTARPLTLDDLDAAFGVYSTAEFEDSGQLALEPEDIAGDWARPSFDLATDSIGVFDGDRLVGAAEVTTGGRRAEGAVLPGERGRGIGSWLAAWTEERATALGSSRIGQVAPDGSLPQRLLRGRGYTLGHTSWVLELPEGREVPQRPLPADYALATGDTAAREEAAYVVIQDAFDEWEGRVRSTFEDWAATTVRRPGAQPWQLRVVEHDGVVVGASFTILDSQGVGYVHQLAVERRHRGKGLAQALLADAFGRARERGATRSELSTDSRTGALDLYLKVGMVVTQVWTHLVTELPR
ncbi:MAG TPA: GNAT family N-acetyltransferase [Ornithinibacter sp.]|nr:GNAT family N-acetyltransferase [Ornithinibacter sp.]